MRRPMKFESSWSSVKKRFDCQIEDNGRGFVTSKRPGRGMGNGMCYRAEEIGGKCEIKASQEGVHASRSRFRFLVRGAQGFAMEKKSKTAFRKQIRAVIADDHPVVREGLRALISSQQDMEVVGEAANGKQAVHQFFLHRPDVLLLDLRMPEMNAIEAIHAILERAPKAKIIVLSTYNGEEDIYQAMKAGAKAYLLKDSPREQLLESIRSVHAGRLSISPSIGVRLAARFRGPDLTDREVDIARLLVAGKTNKEIGASLKITEGTVKVHIRHVLNKLGAGGRTEAIRIALERGIVHLT